MHVYMKITTDRYELPVAVADTGEELAKMCGVSINNVYNTIRSARIHGYKCQYVRVEVEVEVEDDNVTK